MRLYITMAFVCYITYGREKYEYVTDFIGLFDDFQDAAFKLATRLIDHGFLHNYNDEEKTSEMPDVPKNMDKHELLSFVKKYENSYYNDGWDYTVKWHEIEE